MIVALGCDHAGFALKARVVRDLEQAGHQVVDCGAFDTAPSDYPDFARAVAEAIREGRAERAILVCGSGVGASVAANKVPGIRAALCYDKASARNSREHNDSNILTLGGRLLTATQAEETLRVWLATPFAGGRHAARVQKISRIEQKYARGK
jgi:ribose 5-phosphate isomerase B